MLDWHTREKRESAAKRSFLAVCLGFVLLGCGGDEPTPVEKCDTLLTDICTKGVSCLGGTQQECEEAIKSQLGCGNAKGVSAAYGRCIDQVKSNSCASLFPTDATTGDPTLSLPADCQGVILF